VFLCCIFPRYPDYVITGKHQIPHLDARRGQKFLEFLEFRNKFSLRPLVSFGEFSHMDLRQLFGQTPLRGVTLVRLPIQTYTFTLPKRIYIPLLVPGASDPAGLAARLRFHNQECVYIVRQYYTLARVRVELRNLIFVQLIDFT